MYSKDVLKNHTSFGKKAVASLLTGMMVAGPVAFPVAAFAETTDDAVDQPADQNDPNAKTPEQIAEEEAQKKAEEEKKKAEEEQKKAEEEAIKAEIDKNAAGTDNNNPADDTETEEPADDKDVTDPDTDKPADDQTNTDQTTPEQNPEEQNPEDQNPEDQNPDTPSTPEVEPDTPQTPAQPDETPDEPVTPEQKPIEQTPTKPETPTTPSAPEEQKTPDQTPAQNTTSSDHFQYTSQKYVGHHYTQDMTTEKFVASIGEEARQAGQEHNVYASVMIAQAILESESGKSALAQAPNNNLFGIKGTWYDDDGKAYNAIYNTQEDDGTGNLYTISASFRAYPTTKDSIDDYVRLMTDTEEGMGSYYQGAWKDHTSGYQDACVYLQGRYATDINYAQKLMDLIETYDLTRFDDPLDYEMDETVPLTDEEMKDAEYVKKVDPDGDHRRDMTMDDYADIAASVTSYLGTDYVWGGSTPDEGFDCSGLVSYVYKDVLGKDITRTTYTQQYQGEEVDFKDLRMGDLLFFSKNGDVHHVAMYLGDGYYIHAPKPGDEVKITSMDEYTPTFAKRILKMDDLTDEEIAQRDANIASELSAARAANGVQD